MSDSLFQVFDVLCVHDTYAGVVVCVSVDGKFKNIGTNEYFLSCGFSSLFLFYILSDLQ